MPFALLILTATLLLGFILSRKFPKKILIIWGVITMFSIAPLFTWLVAISYGVMVGEGFAAVAVMGIMFPVIFLIGIGILAAGIYKNVTGENF
ncbi:hypothetical protein [Sutcliffiella rhizosphaerae]|uniref:Uncharacterized protein n=1 Tax=Sutcliffiella rhizosphaerae TaxID=2880967 RepID=A0ABM8YRP8_9BACI|nr:hypothetical protein [Sutcliffiella rhizosphaerae]CAG9622498.1 hypothetical protein BACCIP111883_03289 [Sutcliffiella rhizosphaerae]